MHQSLKKSIFTTDINEGELPEHWGGTKVDPVDGDPRCPSLVCLGGQVPGSYYTAPSRRFSIDQNLDTVIVEKKSFHAVEVIVDTPGSMLKWEFKTEDNDIGILCMKAICIVINDRARTQALPSIVKEQLKSYQALTPAMTRT